MTETRRGLGGVYLRGGVWWLRYSYRGTKRRESSHSVNRTDAVKLLKRRLGEMGQGKAPGPDPEKVSLTDLAGMLRDDYGVNGRRSLDRADRSLAHLTEFFGADTKALDITADRLNAYVNARREAQAAPATVRCELAALKRAFNLAVRAGRLVSRPPFPLIQVRNARTGFFEESEFRTVLGHLPAEAAAVAEFLYWTGWRKSEALGLEWRNVDLKAGILRIEDSKNGEPRTMPFRALPDLAALIQRQRERTDAVQAARDIIVSRVFHRDGKPIRDFRGAWTTACAAAGVRRVPHDFRRTAARNLSRAGVPERVIMALCGWKTRAVFDRYRIVNEADLAEGLGKLAQLGAPKDSPKVVPLRAAR